MKMKYSETDLTEATKIISYLRKIRVYAVAMSVSSLLYLVLKIVNHAEGTELYLTYGFTGIIILVSISIIIRLDNKTAGVYGIGCIIAGAVYSFSIVYYRGETEGLFTAIGFIIGLIVIRHGVSVAFGGYSQEAFSRVNQKKVSFIRNLVMSLKKSLPTDKDVIHCTYTDNKGKKRKLKIKLLDDVVCFLLSGDPTPLFFDRNNVFISELQNRASSLTVSINVDDHDWLEAEMKSEDFKKYESWKYR
jgi:hypothetical protein